MDHAQCSRLSYIFAHFPTYGGATEAYKRLKAFVRAAGLEVEAVAVAQRGRSGKVYIQERGDIRTAPVNRRNKVVCSGLINYVTDSLWPLTKTSPHREDTDLKRLGRELTDGTSALLVVVSREMVTAILDHLVMCGAAVTTGPLSTKVQLSRSADFWALVD